MAVAAIESSETVDSPAIGRLPPVHNVPHTREPVDGKLGKDRDGSCRKCCRYTPPRR